jgi:hypothetical protein
MNGGPSALARHFVAVTDAIPSSAHRRLSSMNGDRSGALLFATWTSALIGSRIVFVIGALDSSWVVARNAHWQAEKIRNRNARTTADVSHGVRRAVVATARTEVRMTLVILDTIASNTCGSYSVALYVGKTARSTEVPFSAQLSSRAVVDMGEFLSDRSPLYLGELASFHHGFVKFFARSFVSTGAVEHADHCHVALSDLAATLANPMSRGLPRANGRFGEPGVSP